MHKVVVERPRHGRSWATSKAPLKPPFDESPRYEAMKPNHTRRKWFSDLLGPLRRWLQSQVGRPWNDVYSEACAVIKPDSIIRAHVKTHLLEFVERHTFMHDWLKKNVALQKIHGLWFECHFEVVPVGVRFKAYDHALERVVSRGELTRHDTRYFLCTLKRQLSKRELRRFGLRNASIPHSSGAQS